MKHLLSCSPIYAALFSLSLIGFSAPVLAQGSHHAIYTARDMDNEYDDGYDDGYDDAMEDCACPPLTYVGRGFYFGLGGGYEGYQVVQKPWVFDDRIGTFNTHANGWNGRLFAGYAYSYLRYYLAVEAMLGTSNASGTNTLNTFSTQYNGTFSAGTSYGASLLPGFRLANNGPLIYGRIGAVRTDFTVKDWSGNIGANSSNWQTGMNYGIGVEFPVYKNITSRFEYDYINYSKFNNGIVGSINGSNSAPADNRGTIDFSYHFVP